MKKKLEVLELRAVTNLTVKNRQISPFRFFFLQCHDVTAILANKICNLKADGVPGLKLEKNAQLNKMLSKVLV